jgi:DNA modification methylase
MSDTKQAPARARDLIEPAAEWVPIGDLREWEDNPRKNDGEPVEKVAASIKRLGWGAPIVARANGEIIAGHTRYKAALSLGMGRVPVRYVDLDPADAALMALADNRLNEAAEWDTPKLQSLLGDHSFDDVEIAGWSQADIEAMANDILGGAGSEDEPTEESEQPEPPKVPVTKPGDVWALGDHRILCGDCRNPADVARLLDGTDVNVAFTSPPYASQRKYDESSGFKPIRPDDFVDWFEPVQANVRDRLAADGSWFVNIKEHCEDGQRSLYVKDLTLAHVRRWGWRFVDELCWKHHGFPGEVFDRFRNAWEPVFHFARCQRAKCRPAHVSYVSDAVIKYAPDKRESMTSSSTNHGGAERSVGMAIPRNVLDVSNGASTSIAGHAATFPVGLPTFFVKAYSDPGDVILDPFMGSGTTLIAAQNEGRKGYGLELSPGYCDVIVERWENITGGKAARE